MLKIEEINVGDTVYWAQYGGNVRFGKVVAKRVGRSASQASQICVELSDLLELVDVKGGIYATPREAYFETAQRFQKEAAEKLSRAADAFSRAGIGATD